MLELRMNGPVVDDSDAWYYEWFDEPCVSPKNIREFLENAGTTDISVTINSMGGSVFAGSEIYTALKNHTGHVEVVVGGLAASIASVIAMAGDTIKISPLGQIMIHNAAMFNYGDHQGMSKASEILFNTSESLARVYAQKTGKTVDEMMDLMNKESWFTADKAVEVGLADEVLFLESPEFEMVASAGGYVSKEKIAEFKAILEAGGTKQKPKLLTEASVAEGRITVKEVSDIVSKLLDEKLSDKTKKSQKKPENNTGLENYIY